MLSAVRASLVGGLGEFRNQNRELILTRLQAINTESLKLEFRAEFFNVFNHAQFENPRGDINGSDFGKITNARDARIGQGALKLSF